MYDNPGVASIAGDLLSNGCTLHVDDRRMTVKRRTLVRFEKQGAPTYLAAYQALGENGAYIVAESPELWKRYPRGGMTTRSEGLLEIEGFSYIAPIRLYQLAAMAAAGGYQPATDHAKKLVAEVGQEPLAAGVAYAREAERTSTIWVSPSRDILRLAALGVDVISYTDDALSPGEVTAMRAGVRKVLARLEAIGASGEGESAREADLMHRCTIYLGSCLARHKTTAECHGSTLDGLAGENFGGMVKAVARIGTVMAERARILAGPELDMVR